MPKAYLSFKLPEENEEFKIATKAGSYSVMLWDVQQYARQLDKYDTRVKIPKEEIISKLRELLEEYE